MAWIFLIIGIFLEVLGTTFLKLSDGFNNVVPSILMFVFWGSGFAFLSLALRKIDISIAYAIWSGTGIAFMAVMGIVWRDCDHSEGGLYRFDYRGCGGVKLHAGYSFAALQRYQGARREERRVSLGFFVRGYRCIWQGHEELIGLV